MLNVERLISETQHAGKLTILFDVGIRPGTASDVLLWTLVLGVKVVPNTFPAFIFLLSFD